MYNLLTGYTSLFFGKTRGIDKKMSDSLRGKRLFLADDADFVRLGTAAILQAAGLEVEVGNNAQDVFTFLKKRASTLDIVVVDLNGMGATFEPTRHIPELVQTYPQLPFIVFSAEDYLARELLECGIKGYVVKIDGASGLLKALEDILLKGIIHCSPSTRRDLWGLVSRREREVLALASEGLTSKGIALKMGVSDTTVEEYWKRIRGKLDATSQAQAVAIALREGLIR
jgi:DNA-binding NarL/FixJ family response regulator